MYTIAPADKSYRAHAWLITLFVYILISNRRTLSSWNVASLIVSSLTLHLYAYRSISPERSSALRLTLSTDEYCRFLRFRYHPSRLNLVRDYFVLVLGTCVATAYADHRPTLIVRVVAWILDKYAWYKALAYWCFIAIDAAMETEAVRKEPKVKLQDLDVGRRWTLIEGMTTKKYFRTWVRWIGEGEKGDEGKEEVWELKITIGEGHWQFDADRQEEVVGQILRVSRRREVEVQKAVQAQTETQVVG